MYRIKENNKKIELVSAVTFKEYKLKERTHLQEWIADTPLVLGEELLILAKEFDGFDGTSERLDLLALDKKGHLVIIENKLDDSGRDVTWQAIKYTAYCSTLTQDQVVEIYKNYGNLNSFEAENNICNFLEQESLDDIEINPENTQRIFLVAAHFRKEVTATVLWLINNNIDIRCFRASLFRDEVGLLIDITQIIPTQEAQDFMIKMSQKKNEHIYKENTLKEREERRLEFWDLFLRKAQEKNISHFSNISASTDHWLNAGAGISGVTYTVIFAKNFIRVVLDIHRRDRETNKQIFDYLEKNKKAIETSFGHSMSWLRLDDKISSRIQYEKATDSYNKDNWEKMAEWLCKYSANLKQATHAYIQQLSLELKS